MKQDLIKIKKIDEYSKLSVDALLKELSSNLNAGLLNRQVYLRQDLFGLNVISGGKKLNILFQLLDNFKSPLILILIGVAFFSFLTGSTVNFIIISVMVLLSVVLNFTQEFKANKASEHLKIKVSTKAKVIRNSLKIEVKSSELTVGDIIEFSSGDLISADCRILESKDFFVNQSSLTGESFPVKKSSFENGSKKQNSTDYKNIIFSGTSVLTGTAKAIVINIGKNTEFGIISNKLLEREDDNDFTKGVKGFSNLILKLVIIFVVFIFGLNLFLKQNLYDSIFFAIAVAVGLTPEFLPMIMSVTMGKGSINMSKKGVIVKKLTSIPTFGSMNILCTDKTGTLTLGKIKLLKATDIEGNNSKEVLIDCYLNSFFQTGITNPLDEAVLEYQNIPTDDYTKVDEVPFDFQRKRMSVVLEDNKKEIKLITKGAPEEVVSVCSYYSVGTTIFPLTNEARDKLTNQYEKLSSMGFRVIAVATKTIEKKKGNFFIRDEDGLVIKGFVSFFDPPKENMREVIKNIEVLGIEVKIITGDNEIVTKKICKDIGLHIKGVFLGQEMSELSENELNIKVLNSTIFARFSPENKAKVIELLQKNKNVVGYMGDGINDAISLKKADIGISVNNATDIAKDSADLILTQKNLQILHAGIIEGRKTYSNTLKYIMMGVSSNFGNMFSYLGATIFLPFLPMLPIQILLNNFLYDFAQITIPTDNVDAGHLKKPLRWNLKFIKKFMFIFGPISSVYDYLTFALLFFVFKFSDKAFQTGWFIESLATQTLVIYVIRNKKLSFFKDRPSSALLISTLVSVTIGWLIPLSPISSFFGFVRLPVVALISLSCVVLVYLINIEVGKRLFYKYVSE